MSSDAEERECTEEEDEQNSADDDPHLCVLCRQLVLISDVSHNEAPIRPVVQEAGVKLNVQLVVFSVDGERLALFTVNISGTAAGDHGLLAFYSHFI